MVFFLSVGLAFLFLNKKIARYEINRQMKTNKIVEEGLIKTQLYIAGGLFLFLGFFYLAWITGFFSK